MARFMMTPEQFERDIARRVANLPHVVRRGQQKAGEATKELLKGKTPKNTGFLKSGWTDTPTKSGHSVQNSTPYAGVVEKGARPHGMSQEGIESIASWARTQLLLDEEEARAVAYGVAKKIAREGQKPTFFVKNSLPEVVKILAEKVTAELNSSANRRGG